MKFQYDRFDIEVREHSGTIDVIIADTASKYKRKLRGVATVRRSMGTWVYEVKSVGKGSAMLWKSTVGAKQSKKEAVDRVQRYIRENIERGHADESKPAISIEEEKASDNSTG